MNTNNLKNAVLAESNNFFSHLIEEEKSVKDLYTSRYVSTNDANLRKVYDIEAGATELDKDRYSGVLTRPFFTSAATEEYSTIHRGLHVLDMALCQKVPDPPDNAGIEESKKPEVGDQPSFRELTAAVTKPAACAACHSKINPLGFALSNYDAMGRYITEEKHYENNAVVYSKPVNAEVTPIIGSGNGEKVANAIELSDRLAATSSVHVCASKKALNFMFGRKINAAERCLAESLGLQSHKSDLSFKEMFKQIVMSDVFTTRRIQ